jgi:hypothetical protein
MTDNVTPIRPGFEPELADIPMQLRKLADMIEAANRLVEAPGDSPDQKLIGPDLCLVLLTTSMHPHGMVHSFGRHPSYFEAVGMLTSAAYRVPR